MKLDWERDVKELAEEVGRRVFARHPDGEHKAQDVVSTTWELCQTDRQWDKPLHCVMVAARMVRWSRHFEGRGSPRSIDGVPNTRGRVLTRRCQTELIHVAQKPENVPKEPKDANPERIEHWLGALTPKQATVCRLAIAGLLVSEIAKRCGVNSQGVSLLKRRAGDKLRKLGIAA